MNKAITINGLQKLVEARNAGVFHPGVCTQCASVVDGVEAGARELPCASCETPTIYDADELLMEKCP